MFFTNRTKKIQMLEEKYKLLSTEAFNLSLEGEEQKSKKRYEQAEAIQRKLLSYNA